MKQELINARKQILETSFISQAGHIPSAFSILEILFVLYKETMNFKDDVFILSKGHGCLALYVTFYEMGIISEEDFHSFCSYESKLGGHPHCKKLKEIFASTGSLGHGLPIAIGAALSKKIEKKPGRVFCLIGDGESNEGTIWESALLAKNLQLDNLVCIIDNNKSQIRSLPVNSIRKKFHAFDWTVIEVQDGHNTEQIFEALKNTQHSELSPFCILCNTIKGKGIKEMEDNMFAWHHGPPDETMYSKFCVELDEKSIC